MNSNLSNRLRALRHKKGLSQQNMADELNLTVAAYSNLERGVTQLTVTRLNTISEILNIPVGDFFMDDFIAAEPIEIYSSPRTQLMYIQDQLHYFRLQLDKVQRDLYTLKSKSD